MTPQWMTTEDVCEYLQVSRSTVLRWAKRGRMPAYKFGRALRFKQEDVDALAEPIAVSEAAPEDGELDAEGDGHCGGREA